MRKHSLAKATRHLVAVAMGRQAAEMVIKNGRLVNVYTGEIQDNIDVAITHGRIAYVGPNADYTIGDATEIIDASGHYLSPGFMDGHIHIESAMITVNEYAKAVVPRGTTAVYMDPHEIANVLGLPGVRLMIDESKNVPLRVFVAMPSCVPAAPGFEDTGASIGPEEIAEAIQWDQVVALGEMMNFPGVIFGDEAVHAGLAATYGANKTVTGHFSLPETGRDLVAYIAAGIRCDHESVRAEDALAKMRLGMYAQLREGSAWHDLKDTARSITENLVDSRLATLVSDDTHPRTLVEVGHMDHIVRRAIEEGINPITAIQMATLNVAECFGMTRDVGGIAPGKLADILVLSDLTKVKVEKVLISGELVADQGRMLQDIPEFLYPGFARESVHLAGELLPIDFAIPTADKQATGALVRAMQIIEARVGTIHKQVALPVHQGFVQNDLKQDVVKVAVVERHRASGDIALGFVQGFRLNSGAIASTVAHDSHNLLIVGTNDGDMAFAANELAKIGGGMVAVRDGKTLAMLPLPIAGLMSDRPLREVVEKVAEVDEAWKTLGCDLVSPFMTMGLLALPVLPELRITNRGLVDTVNFEFVDLIVAERYGQVQL